MFSFRIIILSLLVFLFSCNSDKTDEEMKELWSKAQTKGKIIERSGTKFNSAIDMDLAMRDAETRLQSGGGLLGKGGLSFGDLLGENQNQSTTTSVGMPINAYIWKATLETISFMPLSSADPIGGTIITDWYSTTNNQKERCKLNIFISGKKLKTENLKVNSFCQEYKDQVWVNKNIDKENNIKIENAILNRAKKLRIQSSE
ncbi:DUF3576 domain-containing protein [Pelagibacteraceae bacterium]|nr:DUF3576 domain-containing protein [Pelagibacteraceae bacterium]